MFGWSAESILSVSLNYCRLESVLSGLFGCFLVSFESAWVSYVSGPDIPCGVNELTVGGVGAYLCVFAGLR